MFLVKFLPHDAMHSADSAVVRCPSVCRQMSVTRQYKIELYLQWLTNRKLYIVYQMAPFQ